MGAQISIVPSWNQAVVFCGSSWAWLTKASVLMARAFNTHDDGTAKVKVAPCTSSELQKWNAPANFNEPLVLTDTKEK